MCSPWWRSSWSRPAPAAWREATSKTRAEHRPDADEGVQQAVEDLRRRVEVLERIVTDDKRRLAAEINDLDAGERPI